MRGPIARRPAPGATARVCAVPPRGTAKITPRVTTTYTLTMGEVTRTLTVTVAGTTAAAPATTEAAGAAGATQPIPRIGRPDEVGDITRRDPALKEEAHKGVAEYVRRRSAALEGACEVECAIDLSTPPIGDGLQSFR